MKKSWNILIKKPPNPIGDKRKKIEKNQLIKKSAYFIGKKPPNLTSKKLQKKT